LTFAKGSPGNYLTTINRYPQPRPPGHVSGLCQFFASFL